MIPFPCPKCGSIPAVYRKKGIAGPSNFYRERVACKCGMATREHKAPGKAVATWNRRSSPLPSPDGSKLLPIKEGDHAE